MSNNNKMEDLDLPGKLRREISRDIEYDLRTMNVIDASVSVSKNGHITINEITLRCRNWVLIIRNNEEGEIIIDTHTEKDIGKPMDKREWYEMTVTSDYAYLLEEKNE